MITISRAVEETIASEPFLEETLSKGLVNLSALARQIRPQLQKRLYKKDISEASLLMALTRLKPQVKKKTSAPKLLTQMQDITVRSNLLEITIPSSRDLDPVRREIMKAVAQETGSFFNLIQGIKESTFVISKNFEKIISKHLSGKAIARIDNLSAITMALPPENRETPGVYYVILKTLAWNNVNLIEVISNYNEVTLIFDNGVIDKAFSLIKSLTGVSKSSS